MISGKSRIRGRNNTRTLESPLIPPLFQTFLSLEAGVHPCSAAASDPSATRTPSFASSLHLRLFQFSAACLGPRSGSGSGSWSSALHLFSIPPLSWGHFVPSVGAPGPGPALGPSGWLKFPSDAHKFIKIDTFVLQVLERGPGADSEQI